MRGAVAYAAFLWLVSRGDYFFSESGTAMRANGHVASKLNRNGYRRIHFNIGGRRYRIMEHIAFWIYSTGKWPKKGQQINHKNLERSCNALENLELLSASANMKHSHRMRRKGYAGGKK